jgi:ubiquinone/menaquinone biosynthesis C-methylase UbiE
MVKKADKKVVKKPVVNSTLSEKSCVVQNLYKKPEWRVKLLSLLTGILKNTGITEVDIIKIIETHLTDKLSDKKIFTELADLVKKPENLYTEEIDIKRAFGKWRHIKQHLTKRIGSLLDMGGNIGTTAMVLGKKIFKIPRDKILVVDIDEWAGNKWVPRSDITFFHYDNMSKIPDNSVDLITCFHNLHHIATHEYDNIMKQFYRILTPDGCVVLYEHNCTKPEWACIIDIEHALFDIVVSKKISYNNFIQDHYAKYLNITNWQKVFNKHGFKSYFLEELNNKDQSFYLFFSKT